jgi:hypothetical protein
VSFGNRLRKMPLRQFINPIHVLTPCFFKIHINVIIPSKSPLLSNDLFSQRYSKKILY